MEPTYRCEADLLRDLVVVVVPLLDLGLAGGEVGADEADGGGTEHEADRHRTLVARRPLHASFYGVHGNVSDGEGEGKS